MRATSDALLTEWWRLNMIKHARQSLERGAVVVANRNNSHHDINPRRQTRYSVKGLTVQQIAQTEKARGEER